MACFLNQVDDKTCKVKLECHLVLVGTLQWTLNHLSSYYQHFFELMEDTSCLVPCKLLSKLSFIGGNGKLLNLCEDFMLKVSQRSKFFLC